MDEILRAGDRKQETEAQRRKYRLTTKNEREKMLRRHAELEKEIDALYPIPKRIRKASKE